jgi:hypothetical protein
MNNSENGGVIISFGGYSPADPATKMSGLEALKGVHVVFATGEDGNDRHLVRIEKCQTWEVSNQNQRPES